MLSTILQIGSLAGLITFLWKVFEEVNTYLFIKVEVKTTDNNLSIFTQIENKNRLLSKKITHAFIIISHEDFDIVEAGHRIAAKANIADKIKHSDDFLVFPKDKSYNIDNHILFTPLPFYYSENISIADEILTYNIPINVKALENGIYSVRFFLFGEDNWFYRRLHRSTQDLLYVNHAPLIIDSNVQTVENQ